MLSLGFFAPPDRDLVLRYIQEVHQGVVGWVDINEINLADNATRSWIDAQHAQMGRPAGASLRPGYYLFLDGQASAYSGLIDFKRDKVSLGVGIVAATAALYWQSHLNAAFQAFPDGGVFFDVIEQHRDAVRANLERFKGVPGIRSKFEWATRYHNFVCRDFLAHNPVPSGPDADEPYASAASDAQRLEEYLIEEADLAVFPQRITLTPIPPK